MTESPTENSTGTWTVPQCPFAIEYSLRVLDDIRLAVMDAFFSLPRGGAEIGGVLVGRIEQGRVIVTDYQALDCEHAYGPSFQISPRDEQKLAEMLAAVGKNPAAVPVGWYHSHTRSEIFLSDADLAIHKRYFPEPWQIALVLKPHTFEPMRCGFFFREPGGNIQAAATLQEFSLEPLPMRTIPSGEIHFVPDSVTSDAIHADRSSLEGEGPTITVTADRVVDEPASPPPPPPPPSAAVEPTIETPAAAEPALVEPPRLLMHSEPRSGRRLWKPIVAVAAVAAIGVAGYQTRQLWWLKFAPSSAPPTQAAVAFAPVGLYINDDDGQLQIHWDRAASAVQQALAGQLSITDVGPQAQVMKLDRVMLQTGSLTYSRQGESVSVVLALDEPGGKHAQAAASFLGTLPASKPVADNPELRKQNEAMAKELMRVRQELSSEVERNRKLLRQYDDAQKQLHDQARRRFAAQNPK